MVIFWIIFIGLCIFGLWNMLSTAVKEKEKFEKMNPNEQAEYRRKQRENQDKAKYNGLKYTCPMCGSHKIKNITTTDRGISVALFGASSGKIAKLYECDDCKYKW